MKTVMARAEIEHREWLELTIELDETGVIQQSSFHAWGCHNLLNAASEASQQLTKNKIDALKPRAGREHWDLLVNEAFLKLQSAFEFPLKDLELCHCRKVLAKKVDEAIVLGAHTPEKVRAWTSASSGCGTCRPEIEKLLSFRLESK